MSYNLIDAMLDSSTEVDLLTPSPYYNTDKLVSNMASNKLNSPIILNWNIQGLAAKWTNCSTFIDTTQVKTNSCFDIISLQETWCKDTDYCEYLSLPTHNLILKNRPVVKERGGLGIYIRKKLNYRTLSDIKFPPDKHLLYDCLFIEIENLNKNKILFGNIYRTPGAIDDFNEDLNSLLNSVKNNYSQIIITGDFNINLININTQETAALFMDSMMSSGLLPNITLPTRISPDSATLIDNIFTTKNLTPNKSGIIESSISDHYPQFISYNNIRKTRPKLPKYIQYRQINKQYTNIFLHKLNNTNWNVDVNCTDINLMCDAFLSKFTCAYHTCFPIENVKCNKYKHKLNKWLTNGILTSIKSKDIQYTKLVKEKKKTKKVTLQNNYKTYRNILNKTIRLAKSNYWSAKFEEAKGNIKDTWKQIRNILNKNDNKLDFPKSFILNDGQEISNDHMIANSFNTYFTNIGPSLANDMTNHTGNAMSYLKRSKYKPPCGSLLLYPTSDEELLNTVKQLKNKNSCGIDCISPTLLKTSIYCIIEPLKTIINASLSMGQFPRAFKLAKVIPLYKKDDKQNISNYRPISILSSFSKVIEKIVHKRLYSFMIKHDLLYHSQYGFKTNSSTEHAVLELQNKIAYNINNKLITAGVFLDLSKAFDTIDHNILLTKLNYYGVRGVSLDWFRSYLCDRIQIVQIRNAKSLPLTLHTGVPQGSNLGPLLFIIYMNDMFSSTDIGEVLHYADDTCLLYTFKSKHDLNEQLNNELQKNSDWLLVNKLSLNTNKSKCVIFHHKSIICDDKCVLMNTKQIDIVDNTCFLGIQIHKFLDWKHHIVLCSTKITKSVYILKCLKNLVPTSVLKTVYISLVQSLTSLIIMII